MFKQLRPALVIVLGMTLVTGLIYPLALTGVAQLLFPDQANGSLLKRDGKVIGSALIGQNFTSARYFRGRPSATTDADPKDPTKQISAPYNAAASVGSNLGPTSKALADRVKEDVEKLRTQGIEKPPVDLVTTSASGLDPHISLMAALAQIPRIAKERKMTDAELRRLVERHIEGRTVGIIGEPRVNVLKLNLALDALPPR
ncbi:MAG: potassium-transporting ATPase subunit KdpC [Alphaproteobacteria bacterium]